MFLVTFPVLVLKWWRETPRRPKKVWAMDVSKQFISFIILTLMMVGRHLLNKNYNPNVDASIATENINSSNTEINQSKLFFLLINLKVYFTYQINFDKVNKNIII